MCAQIFAPSCSMSIYYVIHTIIAVRSTSDAQVIRPCTKMLGPLILSSIRPTIEILPMANPQQDNITSTQAKLTYLDMSTATTHILQRYLHFGTAQAVVHIAKVYGQQQVPNHRSEPEHVAL